MTTTYSRGTQPPASDAPRATRPAQTAISAEMRLMIKYLAEVDRARQHEHAALRQLQSDLTQLMGRAPQAPSPAPRRAPAAAYDGSAYATPRDAYAPDAYEPEVRPRRGILILLAVAAVLGVVGWVVFTGDDEAASSSGAGSMAGHDMSKMGGATGATAPAQEVGVDLGEFFVKPQYGKVGAGKVTFTVSNSGKTEHEFMIANVDDLPQEDVEQLSSDDVHAKVIASKHGLTSGAEEDVTADLAPGTYLLFCNLPGHFGQGQSATIEVV